MKRCFIVNILPKRRTHTFHKLLLIRYQIKSNHKSKAEKLNGVL